MAEMEQKERLNMNDNETKILVATIAAQSRDNNSEVNNT
jgi:hypothetical protein